MTLLTDAQLAEMEARANAATPGPWTRLYSEVCKVSQRGKTTRVEGFISVRADTEADEPQADADADFIAHARQDVPTLLSDVRELRGLLGALLGWLERVWVDDDYLTIPSHWAAALDADIDRARCSLARAEALTEGGRE